MVRLCGYPGARRIPCKKRKKIAKLVFDNGLVNLHYGAMKLGMKLGNEPRHEKTNLLVSDLVRHKPGCTATEDGERLEISDLESRGIVLSI